MAARARDDLRTFMERELRRADYVLIVCTPEYKRKSDAIFSGVTFEYTVLTGAVLQGRRHPRSIIPVLRAGAPSEAITDYLASKLFADFRADPLSADTLGSLAREPGPLRQ